MCGGNVLEYVVEISHTRKVESHGAILIQDTYFCLRPTLNLQRASPDEDSMLVKHGT